MTLIVDIGQQDLGETYTGYTTTNVSAVVEQVETAYPCITKGLAFASLSQWLKWSCEAEGGGGGGGGGGAHLTKLG